MNEIIGVIGAGTMGNGIAQTAATAGFDVVMCDIDEKRVKAGIEAVSKSLDRFVKKETMTENEKRNVLGRITTATALADLKSCALIVEAATRLTLKRGVTSVRTNQRTNDGQLVGHPRELRQQLANFDAGNIRGNRIELASNLGGGVRLQIDQEIGRAHV